MGVLLAEKCLLAATACADEVGDTAAVAAGQVEQLVPECAGAKAGHDGEILGRRVMSLMMFREAGIVVAVMSNLSNTNTPALALKVAEAFVQH